MTASIDLTGRDAAVVQLVARFGQASSRQVHELLFPDVTYTPADRVLRRLTERQFLIRIERRIVGGSRGGSGQYVYGLGRRGFYMHFEGRYSVWRTVNYHALAVLDTFIAFKRRERAGTLQIRGYSVESECWVVIGGDDIRPDLYLDLLNDAGQQFKYWFEVDMGTESQKQIRDKLARYWRAAKSEDETHWQGDLPIIVWVAIDDERAKELKWLIEQMPREAQRLFRLRTLANLVAFA